MKDGLNENGAKVSCKSLVSLSALTCVRTFVSANVSQYNTRKA